MHKGFEANATGDHREHNQVQPFPHIFISCTPVAEGEGRREKERGEEGRGRRKKGGGIERGASYRTVRVVFPSKKIPVTSAKVLRTVSMMNKRAIPITDPTTPSIKNVREKRSRGGGEEERRRDRPATMASSSIYLCSVSAKTKRMIS